MLALLAALASPSFAQDAAPPLVPGGYDQIQLDGFDLVDPVTGTIALNFNYEAIDRRPERHPSTPHDLVPVAEVPPPSVAMPRDPNDHPPDGGWPAGVAVPRQMAQADGVVWLDGAPVSWKGRLPGDVSLYVDGVRLDRHGFVGARR